MLRLVVARQRGHDLGRGRLAARVAMARQHGRVRFARDNVAHDRQAGPAGDIAQDGMELDVHEHQRLLHALDIRRSGRHELIAVPDQAPQRRDRGGGPDAAAQQPERVQLLEPLAVADVAFAPGDSLHVAGVDEEHLDPARFKDLVQGNPVAPGRLHRDGVDVTGLEPVGQRHEIGGDALELSHRVGAAIGRHRDPVALAAHIDAGGVEVNRLEQLLLVLRALLRTAASGALAFHRRLLHGSGWSIQGQGCVVRGILLNGITRTRVTTEAVATSPDQAGKRGRTTSDGAASALGCSAQRSRTGRPRSIRFLPEASRPACRQLARRDEGEYRQYLTPVRNGPT